MRPGAVAGACWLLCGRVPHLPAPAWSIAAFLDAGGRLQSLER